MKTQKRIFDNFMKTLKQNVKVAFSTIHSLFFLVFFSFMLEPVIINAFFKTELQNSIFGLCILVILSIAKFLFYCGVYAAIVQIVSGEEIIFSLSLMGRNIKKYGMIFFVLMLFRFAFDFIVYTYSPFKEQFSLFSINTISDVFFVAVIVKFLIKDRYCKMLQMQNKDSFHFVKIYLSVFVITCLNITILYLAKIHFNESFFLYRLEILILKYIHLLSFCLLADIFICKYPGIKKKWDDAREVYLIAPAAGGVFMGVASLFVKYYHPVLRVLNLLTPSDYGIREFNQIYWRDRYYKPNKLVAITCLTSNAAEAYEIAKRFKEKGSKVILGGAHVSFLPKEALEYCDSVVIGEAESVWGEILKDYEQNSLKPVYAATFDKDYFSKTYLTNKAVKPLDIARYLQTGRGCKFNCDFCVIPAIAGKTIRKAPLEEVLSLIDQMRKEVKHCLFLDDNIIVDREYAKKFFQALIPKKIKWGSSCSIDIAKDEELLDLAKESGCADLLIGYEISDTSEEIDSKGKFAMAKEYKALTRKIKKKGIGIKAYFIFGFDSDNFLSLWRLWKFCFSIFPNTTILTLLTPLPGSAVFNRYLAEDRIVNLNWRNYAINHFVIKPHHIKRRIYNFFFPLIYVIFLTTTSRIGLCVLIFILIISFFT